MASMRPVSVPKAVALAAAFLGSGCLVEPVDLDGRRCPCAEGWTCSAVTELCCQPEEFVTDFRVAWATERQIWWAWEPTAPVDAPFNGYWLVITTDPSVLDTYDPTAADPPPPGTRVFDLETNEELAGLTVTGTSGVDFVRRTITDGLTPSTTYHARLFTLDGASCPWRSDIVTAQTSTSPPNTIVIFDDAPTASLDAGNDGGPRPLVIADDPMPDHDGDRAILWDTRTFECHCTDAEGRTFVCPRCSGNLKVNDGSAPLTDVAGASSSFEGPERRAILELTVSHDGPSPFHFARTWLMLRRPGDAGCGGPCGARFFAEPISMRASGTQTFQVMLSELVYASDADRPECTESRHLELADLEGASVCQFNFGSQWPQGTVVWLDDIRIRY